MHEIGALHEALTSIEKIAEENDITRIATVVLDIGELTGLLPAFFEKYYPIVIEDRPLFQGAELVLNVTAGEALCTDCGALYNLLKNGGSCPSCKSREKTILGGTEFLIKEIVVYQEEAE